MDNLLSRDEEIFYLKSDFNIWAYNIAALSKLKRKRTGQTDIIFKPELQPETTERGYFSKIRLLIHYNIPKKNHKKHLPHENVCETKPAGCCSVITSEKSEAIKKPVAKNLSLKRLMKYYRYACN